MKSNVEGSGHFDGIYQLEQGYHNNRKRGIHDISIRFPVWPVKIPVKYLGINPSISDHIILPQGEAVNSIFTQTKQMVTGSSIRF